MARHRLEQAISDDPEAVRVPLRWLDGPGLWRAYRYALVLPDPEERARILERVHWHLNVRLFGLAEGSAGDAARPTRCAI